MKTNQTPIVLFPVVLIMALETKVFGQDNIEQGIKKQVESGHFIFVASSASPLRGTTRFLNLAYYASVNNDTVVSYLPYFGVDDQPTLTTDEAGIRFTSTKFEYKYKKKVELMGCTNRF